MASVLPVVTFDPIVAERMRAVGAAASAFAGRPETIAVQAVLAAAGERYREQHAAMVLEARERDEAVKRFHAALATPFGRRVQAELAAMPPFPSDIEGEAFTAEVLRRLDLAAARARATTQEAYHG